MTQASRAPGAQVGDIWPLSPPVQEAVWTRVMVEPASAHWHWTGAMRRGTPVYHAWSAWRRRKVMVSARTLLYWLCAGPHRTYWCYVVRTCEEPRCVNPDHCALQLTVTARRATAARGEYRKSA
jgi:hypothetical protein